MTLEPMSYSILEKKERGTVPERNRSAGDAGQCSRGTNHRIQPRNDACLQYLAVARKRRKALTVHVAPASLKQARIGVSDLHPLHADPKHPTCACSNAQSRNKDSSRHLDPESHDRQRAFDDHCDQYRLHDRPDVLDGPRIHDT